MNNRLQSFINAENLTQAQFADSLGVARASISHILSGRNKPGFDFIERIARKYPDLNLEWLITGKGKMYNSPVPVPVLQEETSRRTPENEDNLFPVEDMLPAIDPVPVNKDNSTSDVSKSGVAPVESAGIVIEDVTKSAKKEISQIIIFFEDGTYSKVY